ncbi:hypothetical protein GF324_10510 [bacterium]|nr:hypothetical protein [bacterium]
MTNLPLQRVITLGAAFLLVTVFASGCAQKGLLVERYPPDTLRVDAGMPYHDPDRNPTFLVYGDTQAGRLAKEKFYRRRNWVTWKSALVPFYQLYLLGNGVVGGVNWLRHIPDYGRDSRLMMRDAIYQKALENEVAFILNVGDICYTDGRYPHSWAGFLRENKWTHPLLREIPYFPVAGNHERANDRQFGWPNYQAVFDHPRFYVMEFKDLVLFVLDSNFILDQDDFFTDAEQDSLFQTWFVSDDPDRPAWLERKLEQYEQKTYKMVISHHPLVTFGAHFSDWLSGSNGPGLEEKRRKLIKLLSSCGVNAHFAGHEHYYQHNVITTHYGDLPLHCIVTSGGGVPVRNAPSETERIKKGEYYAGQGIHVSFDSQAEVHHFTRVRVMDDRLSVETFEVSETGVRETPIDVLEINEPLIHGVDREAS